MLNILNFEPMKKLLIVALMLAFTLPSFAQVPTQDTTRRTTEKTMKHKKGKWKDQKDTSGTMKRDTSGTNPRDTSKRY